MKNKLADLLEAKIAKDVVFGEGSKVVMPSNLYGCSLGKNCFVGPFVEIQKGVKIGDGTRVQSHSFLCELVTVGKNCFIGHGVMFANDTFSELERPAYTEREQWIPTSIGDNVTIGNNATILPVRICDNVIIGAGAVVTKDITRSGVYTGVPAKYLRALQR